MPIDQGFRLVTLELPRIFRIPLEIPPLQQAPIDLFQLFEVLVEIRRLEVRMPICENKGNTFLMKCTQGGDQDHEILILLSRNTPWPVRILRSMGE